jgi:hypothetical protein
MDEEYDIDDDAADDYFASPGAHRGDRVRHRMKRYCLRATLLVAIAALVAQPVRATLATEETLYAFFGEQVAQMIQQFDLQFEGWGFHRDLVNGGIQLALATIYDELAERKRYREIGFAWETPDRAYGRVDRLLGLLEGDVPQTEAADVAMENAYVQVVDMKTGEEQRKLVLERYPGAALRYARYAAVMKCTALGGDIYGELEKHRKTVDILKRVANLPQMSPGRSEQIMKIVNFYESILETDTAELDAVRSNAEGIDRLYENYEDNFREAARYQAGAVARRQSFALEVAGKRVYEHSWE